MPCKTTAVYRNEAIEAEQHLEWGRAADLWQAAMDNYPRPIIGQLARRDIDQMERRMRSCLQQYFPA